MIDDKTLEALENRAHKCVECIVNVACAGCGNALNPEEIITIIVELKEVQQLLEKQRAEIKGLKKELKRWENMSAEDFGEMLGGM